MSEEREKRFQPVHKIILDGLELVPGKDEDETITANEINAYLELYVKGGIVPAKEIKILAMAFIDAAERYSGVDKELLWEALKSLAIQQHEAELAEEEEKFQPGLPLSSIVLNATPVHEERS